MTASPAPDDQPAGEPTGELSDEELLAAFPGYRIDSDNAAHHRGLLRRRLVINRCTNCRTWHHPPRPVCPSCWSDGIEAAEVAGTGSVALVTVLRQGPSRAGIDYTAGHALVAVELDEQPGLRVSGAVVGTPADSVRVGDRVHIVWRDVDGQPPRPDFEVTR